MKKKKNEIITFIIIILCTTVCVMFDYRQEKREQQERMEFQHQSELKSIAYVTTGHYYILSDVINPGFDTGYVIMLVTLYNECIDRGEQEGEKISGYVQVYEEYEDYMNGRKTYEECKTIIALGIFHEAEYCYRENTNYDIGYRYDYYVDMVGRELGNSIGDIYSDYTWHIDSEVEAASKIAAKKWCDYMESE